MDTELNDLLVGELDKLYRFSCNCMKNEIDAEDLTQDIVLAAIRSYSKIEDKNKLLPWLWGIAQNVYKRSFYKQREIPTDEIIITDIAGASYDTPESEYLKNDETIKIRRALSYLAKSYRDVAVKFYLENKNYSSIAKELDIPLSSVKWRLNQSKEQIREEFIKMDNSNIGYKKVQKLLFRFGGYVGKIDQSGNYEGADRALEGLFPQNICLIAYDDSKTITEISSEMGIPAEYVEDAVKKLVDTQVMKQTVNRYQTNFPILSKNACEDIFEGNIKYVQEQAEDIIRSIYALSENVKNVGFYGSKKPIEKLIVMLMAIVCQETAGNVFDTVKLPFHGTDKSWYILGTTADKFNDYEGNGTSWSKYSPHYSDLVEYFFHTRSFKDERDITAALTLFQVLYDLKVEDEYQLAYLIENGKIIKTDNKFTWVSLLLMYIQDVVI